MADDAAKRERDGQARAAAERVVDGGDELVDLYLLVGIAVADALAVDVQPRDVDVRQNRGSGEQSPYKRYSDPIHHSSNSFQSTRGNRLSQ